VTPELDHLRLRLASRTLLEWQTPFGTAEYQAILKELLAVHPMAKTWGLNPDQEFLQFDTDGAVLWYLSESLTTAEPDMPADYFPETIELPKRKIKNLIENLFHQQIGKEIWPGGPTVMDISDKLFVSFIIDNAEYNYAGISALLSIIMPINQDLKKLMVNNIKNRVIVKPYLAFPLLENQKMIMRNITFFSKLSVYLVIIIIMLSIAYYYYDFKLLFIYPFIMILLIYLLINKPNFILQRIMRLMIKIFSGEYIKSLQEEIDSRISSLQLTTTLGTLCGCQDKYFVSVLSDNQDYFWQQLALQFTKEATPEVTMELLRLLRDPTVADPLKPQILRWLCKVHIKKPDDMLQSS
jgi:hypothetical protein